MRRRGRLRWWIAVLWVVEVLCLPPRLDAADPRGAADCFYFAQITDTHWGARGTIGITRKAVAALNKIPVKLSFVVHTGDIFADTIRDEGVMREGLQAMRSLKAPVYYLPGNHDLLEGDREETELVFSKSFGPLQRVIEVNGVLCLFLCSEVSEEEGGKAAGKVQRKWIEDNIGKDEKRRVLVFLHRPPVADRLAARTREEWGEESHPQWEKLFQMRPQIQALVSGHLHRDELHWIGAVPVYVASSVAPFWNRQPSVRLYRYEAGRLSYWTIYL